MQIQVRINEDGALRNQRYAFTDKFTLISELMQNARRAGARRIEIHYDDTSKILRVIDDGGGIDDFQKLLTFNESGWNPDTCIEERPFGIGFSKCLYSASRCIVTSGHQRIDFLTADALARQPVDMVDVEYHANTLIELHDVDLPGLSAHLETMCSGFPVPVWFNASELPRIHAIDHMPFVATEIGQVYLAGTGDGRYSKHALVFLQGFCVIRPTYYLPGSVNVVHLDSKQFIARLPDRDKLIDEADQSQRIHACLKSLWRQVLLETQRKMANESFIDTFFDVIQHWDHRDVLNTIPLLPKCLCKRITGYPIQEEYEEHDCIAPVEHLLTRGEIESGEIVLVDLSDVSSDNTAFWMFAKAKGYLVISVASLHRDHWVHPHVRAIEEEEVHVEAIGEQCRARLQGLWLWTDVLLCESVSVTIGVERITLIEEGLFYNDVLFIPAGEQSGEPARQASSFVDGFDQFRGDYRDADCDALANLLRRLRSVDPKATLDSLLQELHLETYPLLHGKTFQLTVGGARGNHAVELVN
jgi:hypothetical protein